MMDVVFFFTDDNVEGKLDAKSDHGVFEGDFAGLLDSLIFLENVQKSPKPGCDREVYLLLHV
jgi:hypothetical protein